MQELKILAHQDSRVKSVTASDFFHFLNFSYGVCVVRFVVLSVDDPIDRLVARGESAVCPSNAISTAGSPRRSFACEAGCVVEDSCLMVGQEAVRVAD